MNIYQFVQELGKRSRKLLELAYPPEKYGAESLDWLERVPAVPTEAQYWYGTMEEKASAWDIDYVKKHFPEIRFVKLSGLDHAEYALLHPSEMTG